MADLHTGETGVVYSRDVAQVATELISRLNASQNEPLCGALYAIVRIAEAEPGHVIGWTRMLAKFEAFGVPQTLIGLFRKSMEEPSMSDLVEFIHPTVVNSQYNYRFRFQSFLQQHPAPANA